MATLSTTELNWLAREWARSYSSAVLSGIVGDLAHKARGGYHISREDQPSTNYSVTRPDDRIGPSDRASAIDMTMSTADIIKCHTRLRGFWQNRANDPRMKYINAWNGWDGNGDAGRYDVVKGTVGTATADHKWHIHLEIRRRYVNDHNAMLAILSMLRGQSLESWQGKPPVTPTEDDDMNEAELIAGLTKWANSADGREAIAFAVAATDDIYPTPPNYSTPTGEQLSDSNPYLTLKDIVYRTASTVAKISKDLDELKKGQSPTNSVPSVPPAIK